MVPVHDVINIKYLFLILNVYSIIKYALSTNTIMLIIYCSHCKYNIKVLMRHAVTKNFTFFLFIEYPPMKFVFISIGGTEIKGLYCTIFLL